jgi:hypothetical protein
MVGIGISIQDFQFHTFTPVVVLYTFTRTVFANSLSSTTKQHQYRQLPLNDDNRWRKELPISSDDFLVDFDDYDHFDYGHLNRLKDSSAATVYHLNITCFMCLYINDLNQQQLNEPDTNCLDPFIPDNIPRAKCDGPCAVSIFKISITLYSVYSIGKSGHIRP